MWSIEVAINAGIVQSNLGPHIFFESGDIEYADFGPYFSSPHVNVLDKKDAPKAKARLTTLLRLISGVKILQGSRPLNPRSSTLYYLTDSGRYDKIDTHVDLNTLLEELANPFDSSVLKELNEKEVYNPLNQTNDYFQLCVDNDLVREVILLLTLGEEQALYFLINTYKIVENILNDLKLTKNNSKVHTTNKSPEDLPSYLLDSLSDVNEYAQYINSRDASGILSRHGVTKISVPQHTPSMTEIRKALILAVNDWLNYKCITIYGSDYKQPSS